MHSHQPSPVLGAEPLRVIFEESYVAVICLNSVPIRLLSPWNRFKAGCITHFTSRFFVDTLPIAMQCVQLGPHLHDSLTYFFFYYQSTVVLIEQLYTT
jgi:hypothetical protein